MRESVSSDPNRPPLRAQDAKTVRIFDTSSGKEIGKPIAHILDVVGVQVNRWGTGSHRKCIMIDRNRDLYVVPVGQAAGGKEQAPYKLGTMCDSAVWNTGERAVAASRPGGCVSGRTCMPVCMHTRTGRQAYTRTCVDTSIRTYIHTYMRTCVRTYFRTHIHTYVPVYIHTYIHTCPEPYEKNLHAENDMLSAIMDGKLVVWYYPNVVFVDRDLVNQTKFVKESSDFGKDPQIMHFHGTNVTIRRSDGAQLVAAVSPYPTALYGIVQRNMWEQAIQLCRYVKDPTLWACLAVMALADKELSTTEVAFAAIDEVAKLQCVPHTSLPYIFPPPLPPPRHTPHKLLHNAVSIHFPPRARGSCFSFETWPDGKTS